MNRKLVIAATPSGYYRAQKIYAALQNEYIPKHKALTGIDTELAWLGTTLTVFANRSTKVSLDQSITGSDVYIIDSPGSTATMMPQDRPAGYEITMNLDDYIVQDNNFDKNARLQTLQKRLSEPEELYTLLSTMDAVKKARAERITCVVPCFYGARQDRQTGRESLNLQMTAKMVQLYADQVLTVDIHNDATGLAFGSANFDSLPARRRLTAFLRKECMKPGEQYIVVAPDAGALKNVEKFADILELPTGHFRKRRDGPNSIGELVWAGSDEDLAGRHAILVDDMIDTGGTTIKAAKRLRDHGAKSVIAVATHAVFSESYAKDDTPLQRLLDGSVMIDEERLQYPNGKIISCFDRFEKAVREGVISEVIVTNTITHASDKTAREWLRRAGVTNFLAKGIHTLYTRGSLSELVKDNAMYS
jgi:ribose-phosphate pyrophosphokinase